MEETSALLKQILDELKAIREEIVCVAECNAKAVSLSIAKGINIALRGRDADTQEDSEQEKRVYVLKQGRDMSKKEFKNMTLEENKTKIIEMIREIPEDSPIHKELYEALQREMEEKDE